MSIIDSNLYYTFIMFKENKLFFDFQIGENYVKTT